MINYWLFRH